ncbi:MAG TPA: alkaline phosphatase D family protein [Xanthobacteraceae bacterium]|nr:alkaline phosphatase D family protein [Xanthobacteraceae bacterium]
MPTTKARTRPLTRALTRRKLLVTGAASAGLTALGGIAKPHLSRAADRPHITHGIQSGDVTTDSGMVWARADRPARMLVEVATTDSFKEIRAGTYVDALPESDFTAKALIEDLPAGADIFYRIRFQDLASPTILGAPMVGHFRTAPDDRRSLSFVWSGDTAGQGWGIDEARGGMRTYATMRANQPDFFIHSGDTIYADCTIRAEQRMPDGDVWRNVVTEEKDRAAESLADYRGNYKYNLLDANLRAFNAQVPIFAQWDDHEVRDDWGPGEVPTHPRSDLLLLAARGCRAFHEFMPMREAPSEPGRIYRKIPYGPLLDVFMLDMRSYRGPNGNSAPGRYGPASHLLGPKQLAWLKRELKASRATWKVIAADLPLGLQSYEGVGMGDGPPRGRELEIADLLAFIKRSGIHNTLWITADVHYTAAHYYDPNRAQFQDFEPFWEFVSGPIHAGTWWPGDLDDTFGPRVAFQKASSRERGANLPPSFGLQFFGHVAIDGASEVMTVTLKDVGDVALWSVDLAPKRDPRSGPS